MSLEVVEDDMELGIPLLGSPNGMTTGALAAAPIVSCAGGGGSSFISVSSSESDSC